MEPTPETEVGCRSRQDHSLIAIREDIEVSAGLVIGTIDQAAQLTPKQPSGLRESSNQSPKFIYSYTTNGNGLYSIDLSTARQSCIHLPSYVFRYGCCWSELPGGSLLITGGAATEKVDRIDVPKEFAIVQQAPMLNGRQFHAAQYHDGYVYVLGGLYGGTRLALCERHVCAEKRWESLSPLPVACWTVSVVVTEGSLYALGGTGIATELLDQIQVLSLETLTWKLLELRLPAPGNHLACFKVADDSQVYFVLLSSLYSLQPQLLSIIRVKTLPRNIANCFIGPSYYSKGTIYCSSVFGEADSLEIGSLSS
jgi:hypothetical protein